MVRQIKEPIDTSSYQNIPPEMRKRRQWVCYTLEPGKDERITKIPREPKTGARAKINEPSGAWCTFEEALQRIQRYDGLEYMLTADDPFTFIDLDHCIDETTGEPQEWAQRIINRFDSYTELSQSGNGIHIIGCGSKPGQRCRTSKQPGIEIYDHSRPIVMTGKIVQGKSTIEACGNEINGLYSQLFASEEAAANAAASRLPLDTDHTPASTSAPAGGDLSDTELVEKAMNSPKSGAAFTLLWNGNTAEYAGDDSAADQALCNHLAWWTNRDPERIDRLFRQSGLMRDKWNRKDYRDRTISLAIRDTQGGYTGGSHSRSAKSKNKTNDKEAKGQKNKRPSALTTGEVEFTPELKHLTDLGNAEYLIDRYGADLRFNVDSKSWVHWIGTHWQCDDTGEIERVTREAIRSLYDLLRDTRDPDKAKSLFGHIKKSESKPRLDATISLARYCSGIPIQAHDLDADQWLFNCPNGTIDLQTGKLQPHRQSDLIAKIGNVDYDPDAKCPRWLQFLDEIFMGDQDLVDFARRFIGYCLTGDTREESVFILYGRGQCGKSKFLDTIRYIIGDYIRDTPVTTFTERNDTNTADLASLVGARLVTASEAEENQAFNEPLLKRISGRDPITCRHLYQNFFTYIPTFKVVVATNDVPRIKSQGFAMKRRIKIIPFRQRFYDPEDGRQPVKDDQIGEKLLAEAAGILTWAVQGCLEWQRDGLQVPDVVKREVAALFESQDPLAEFLDEKCHMDREAIVEVKTIWKEYLTWCDENSRKPAFRATQWFSRNLTQRDEINSVKGVDGVRMLRGVTLRLGANGSLFSDQNGANGANEATSQKSSHVRNNPANFTESTQFAPFAPFEGEFNFLDSTSDSDFDPDNEVEL